MSRPGLLTAKGKFATITALIVIASAVYWAAGAAIPSDGGRNSVTISYVGAITSSCELKFDTFQFELGPVAPDKTADVSFSVDCNEPYQITLQSTNGGLLGPPVPSGRGFSNLVPYELEVSIAGGPSSGSCRSETLKSTEPGNCRVLDSGGEIAAGLSGLARLRLKPGSADYVAGNYADTITINIQPRGV